MLKLVVTTLAVLLSFRAHAETYKCIWTEPFVEILFDQRTGTLEVIRNSNSADPQKMDVRHNTVGFGAFKIVDQNGAVLVHIEPGQGSDGMSEIVYPYIAVNYNVFSPLTHSGACTKVKKSDRVATVTAR
jgi:uncharacterized membrane protein